jgi:drug/metabolite transporter (DMT)-like permease
LSASAAAAAVSVLLWASAFVVIRFAGRELAPGPLALARLAVGTLALGALMLWRREPLPRGRALAGAVASGLLWFGLYNVALNAAERRIDAGTASLLVNTAPIFVALLAAAVLRERLSGRLVAGCLVAFTGAALIGLGVSRHGLAATWGAALCVIAALAYAVALIAQKPALRSASALSVTWTACFVATLACLPYAGELVDEAGRASTSSLLWAAYLGLGPTAVGFSAWAFALARTDASRLGVTTYLVPPLAVLLGWVALSETPPLLALPGGALCLAGVWVARRRPPQPAGSPSASSLARAGRSRGPRASAPGSSTPAPGLRSRRLPRPGAPWFRSRRRRGSSTSG